MNNFFRAGLYLALTTATSISFAQGMGGTTAAANGVSGGATNTSRFETVAPPAAQPTSPQRIQTPSLSPVERAKQQRDLDLINAAFAGETWRIRELLAKGANVNAADWQYGFTPLMWAARNGHVGAVRYLLQRGAKVNAKSKVGVRLTFLTTSQQTTINSGEPTLTLVSESGGVSALMAAAASGWGMAARELIARGADVNLENPDGDTVLMATAFHGDLQTTQALLAKGAKPNAVDKYGRSALWLAAMRGHESIVREMLRRGAKPSADKAGLWPSDAASTMGFKTVAALLARAERAPRAALRRGTTENATSVPTPDRAMTGPNGIVILN
ncbi:MAG TPA: ankyrin repeat domain-containing protein [Abditibacteriaceae bacterium]|jgi:ankyrin repeat protein